MGMDTTGAILVVHHLFKDETKDSVRMRIFSARKATNNEAKHYQER